MTFSSRTLDLSKSSKLEFCTVTIMSNNKKIKLKALVDNQASANIMDQNFAEENGIGYQHISNGMKFQLADEGFASSVGSAEITIDFNGTQDRDCEFQVLNRALAPLILGRLFHNTHIAKTLKPENKERQSELIIQLGTVGDMGVAQAAPMRGASGGAMSLAYAEENGYQIDRTNAKYIVIGDGSSIYSIGIVRIPVKLKGIAIATPTLEFYVIKGLPFELLLGNTTVKERHLFDTNFNKLDWIYSIESNPHFCSFGLDKRKKGLISRLSDIVRRNKVEKQNQAYMEYDPSES